MKIERNVPMPVEPNKERAARVPVESMEIGDSIFFAGTKRQVATSTCHATAMKARLKMRFKSAAENDGARVWRVA